MVIGTNTRRAAAKMAEEDMENMGAQYNQVPPFKEVFMGDQVPIFPPPMIDGEIGEPFLTLTQAMTSQTNAVTLQVQAMTDQINWDAPEEHRWTSSASTC